MKRPLNHHRDALGSFTQRGVVKMDVAVRRASPPVTEQAPRDMQAFPVHDRVRGVRGLQVM